VRAVIEPLQRVPGDRLIPVDLAPGAAQAVEVAPGSEQAAVAVDDESHPHAGARAFLESFEHFVCHAAAKEQIGLEMNAVLCGADGG